MCVVVSDAAARNCAFVNFTNISNALKAIDNIKTKPDYANLRIAHGKDRCANPPRAGPPSARIRSAVPPDDAPESAHPPADVSVPSVEVEDASGAPAPAPAEAPMTEDA